MASGNRWVDDGDGEGHFEDYNTDAPVTPGGPLQLSPEALAAAQLPTRSPTTDPGAWGHRGRDIVNDGRGGVYEDPFSNGSNQDVNRYRGLGSTPTNATGPQIQNGSRDLGLGALGLLRARAEGAETPADVQAREQTAGAVQGIQSGAASIKGGAGARAAAARGAVATGARVQAQGDQDAAALHARGIADASNQYFGTATGQRATDLGVATTNAKLQAGQNALNDNRENFYEGLAQDTQNAQLNHLLGRNEAESAAAGSAFNTGQARDAADRQATRNTISTGAAIGQGTISGVQTAAQQGGGNGQGGTPDGDPNDPWSKGNYSGSSEEMKTDIRPLFGKEDTDLALTPPPKQTKPVSDKRAAELVKQGKAIEARTSAQRAGAGLSTVDTPGNISASKGIVEAASSRKPDIIRENPYGEARPRTINDAIAERVAQDAPPENRYGLFEPEDGGAKLRLGGNRGYAASRAGHPGAMFFGAAPVATHGYERPEPVSPERAARNREVALSDPKAKQEAYALGRAHGFEQVTTGKPVEWSHPMPKDIVDKNEGRAGEGAEQAPTREPTSFKREKPAAPATASLTAPKGAVQRGIDALAARPFTTSPGSPWAGTEAVPAFQQAVTTADKGYRAALAGTPPGSARAMTSDPRAKEDVHGSPMAAANRSMEPFSYEYKAEFTPSDQSPHEKNVGPMANKMEADPVARTAIVKDPGTGLLAIDKTKGLKLVMGGLSSLQRQVDQMEKRRA